MKTREELEKLKQSYRNDAFDNIEDVEGFEEYREELTAFAQEVEKENLERYLKQVADFPAFPTGKDNNYFTGLTIRDYFAVTILNGILANPDFPKHLDLVADARQYADALILELNKPEK